MKEARPFNGGEVIETRGDNVNGVEIIVHAIPGGVLVESVIECVKCWIGCVIARFKKKDS